MTFDAVLTFEEFELLRDKQVEMSEAWTSAQSPRRGLAAASGISKCMKGDDYGYAYHR